MEVEVMVAQEPQPVLVALLQVEPEVGAVVLVELATHSCLVVVLAYTRRST